MIYKNDDSVKNTSYINKDFQALWQEMLELIPKYTNKWNPSQANESDPLAVLVKLLAIFSDKLNYNIDKNILEAYPQSLTQEKAAYNVYDILGYNPPWYQSATTDILLNFHTAIPATILIGEGADKDSSYRLVLPKFTQITDEDSNLIYTLLEDFIFTSTIPVAKQIKAIQGTINNYTINGIDTITVNNLDSDNRLYFIEPNVAENGIFISNDNFQSDFADGKAAWSRIQNIYQAKSTDKVFEFGIDPVSGACYIQFSDSISNLIGEGLSIKYLLSDGSAGNTKSYTLNKFLSDTNSNVIDAGDVTTFKINDYINIVNRTEITSGKSPATLDEMYKNYKRIQNTFNTLVTLLDYENYLYEYGDSSSHIVSNILASDRTNDLYESYDVWTIKDNVNALVHKIKQKSGVDTISKYSIRLYPLAYERDVTTRSAYNRTFETIRLPRAASETFEKAFERSKFNAAIADVKAINHDFIPFGNPFIINYDLEGQVYLTDKVSRAVADQIEANIEAAIYKALNSREITFGDPISYKEVLDIIEKADSRIEYVALNPIDYNKYPVDLSESGVNANIDKVSQVTEQSIINNSILAGKTPWAEFDTAFDYTAAQARGYVASVPLSSAESPNKLFTRVVLGRTDSNGRSITNDTYTYNYYKVEKNEDLTLFAPSYKDDMTYSNFLYYYIRLENPGDSENPRIISKDTPYQLAANEVIYFYETKDAYKEDLIGNIPQGKKNVIGVLKTGDMIKCNFDLRSSDSYTSADDLKRLPLSLNNGKTIVKISLNSGSIYIRESDPDGQGIIAYTNAKGLSDAFKDVNTASYTLLTGEYFLFKYKNDNSLTILGEGTTLINNGNELDLKVTAGEINFDLILDGNAAEVSRLDDYANSLTSDQAEAIDYIVNQILTFGQGYVFAYREGNTIIANTFEELIAANNTSTIKPSIFTINNADSLYYTTNIDDDNSWTKLPSLRQGDNWKGFIRLFADISKTSPALLIRTGVNEESPYGSNPDVVTIIDLDDSESVPHQQQIYITPSSGNVIKLPILGGNAGVSAITNSYPANVQSNITISTPGGIEAIFADAAYFYLYNTQDMGIIKGDFSQLLFGTKLDNNITNSWTVPGESSLRNFAYPAFNVDACNFAIIPMINASSEPFNLGYYMQFSGTTNNTITTNGEITTNVKLPASSLSYILAPCGASLFNDDKVSLPSDYVSPIYVGPIRLISNETVYGYDSILNPETSKNTIKALANEYKNTKLTNTTNDYKCFIGIIDPAILPDPAFNPTYQVSESDLIENPLLGVNYLNKNHIYNRYAIPKLENFNIKISGLSIL